VAGVWLSIRPAERHPEEKPQGRDGAVQRRDTDALRQVQLEPAHVLKRRRLRRAAEEGGKVLDGTQVVALCVGTVASSAAG